MVPGNITKRQLIDFLNTFSISQTANVVESPSTYQVFGQFQVDDVINFQQMILQAKQEIPAQLQFIPELLVPFLLEFQPERNSQISVVRDTGMNTQDHPDYSVTKNLQLVLKRLVPYLVSPSKANQLTITRTALEPLFQTISNNGVSVTRSTSEIKSVLHMIQMVLNRVIPAGSAPSKTNFISISRPAITDQYTVSRNETLSVTRKVGSLSNSTLLTGTWNLDGSVIMNRSAYPVTIKINGTAV